MDYRNSNKAGRPLPSIPRRTSSRSAHTHTASGSLPASTTTTLVLNPASPSSAIAYAPISLPRPDETVTIPESDSSSSSGQPTIIILPKRVRGQRSPPQKAEEQFTLPLPATRSKPVKSKAQVRECVVGPSLCQGAPLNNETPQSPSPVNQYQESSNKFAKPQLNFDRIPTRHVSESHIDILMESPSLPTTISAILPSEARFLRKKSGELIKPSLKSAKRPELTVTTTPLIKSEPGTPMQSKFVHFDSQLEHVKLFLAEQQPLAVSRDGSPTDTSETDNDFPAFIYGHSSSSEVQRMSLEMQVTNMSKKLVDADVALQELNLSQDSTSIHGRVRLKNIAFEKWLAVRFTFDSWQTTSEVTAKYVESIEDKTFDIFAFTIRLNDIMAGIEEKTLFLALRYTVAGKEIWDNNSGENYLAKFTKSKGPPAMATSSNEDVSGDSCMTDLNSKLEQVHSRENGTPFLAQRVHRQTIPDAQKPPHLRTDKSLSARYDFSASLKNNSWKGLSPTPARHVRASTYPSSPNTIPWPRKTSPMPKSCDFPPRSPRTSAMGSPGLDDVARYQSVHADSDIDNPSFHLPSAHRHHQIGCFDGAFSHSSGVEKTLDGKPLMQSPQVGAALTLSTTPSLPRLNSLPPRDIFRKGSPYSSATFAPTWAAAQHVPCDSEDSTPSISSPSSSSTSSPSLSPMEDFSHKATMNGQRSSRELSPASPSSCDDYSSFLNRFCFYTGKDSQLDDIPRSHSASSIEEFLLHSPPIGTFSPNSHSPPNRRSASFDEISCRSGSSTPTANSVVASRSSTPI